MSLHMMIDTVKLKLYNIKKNNMALIDTLTTSPIVKSFLAGSFSGTCSTILFQPLDLVKTRLQTSIQIGSRTSSGGMVAVFGRVVKNEHIFGLWKGMTPSIMRTVPGVGLYFSSLQWLKANFCADVPPGPFEAICLGVMARTVTAVTMIPFTVIKTRYESDVYSYKNMFDAIKIIYAKEGVKGFTCGLLPTLLRDAPFSGLYLMFYTQTKNLVPQSYTDTGNLSAATHFSCGVTAGILASGVTQPFDVLKTKMQLYPDKFNNIFQVAVYVRKKYGPQGYFKGLVPRMIRRTLMAAMAWTVYEQIMQTVGLK